MKLPGMPVFKLPTLSKREVVLVAVFLAVSLTTVYYKYIFEPQWNKIMQLRQELEKQQGVLNLRLNQGWDNISELEEQAEKLRSGIEKLYLTVPNIKDEPRLLVDFYKLTGVNNLRAETIKFSELKEVKNQAYSVFSVSLEVTGRNSDIYNFIGALENYPRSHRIAEIKFEPQSSHTSKCSLAVEFYVLHEIQPDPLTYPFMEGVYGKGQPYQIFDYYNDEEVLPAQETTEPREEQVQEPEPAESEAESKQVESRQVQVEPVQPECIPADPSDNKDLEMPKWLRVILNILRQNSTES
ncbi:type 4a pilus biogenesis protein PilO [Desulfolucanica intricata]|uniref:type 4a pilus biogenesis protein PilO n=1 Tax=Desulfolucanica intricata TaxID=1285191 RepID=UPI000829B799|nr:type 4a pilus biogenesis protein PilO [Desulfolucanica intricata]